MQNTQNTLAESVEKELERSFKLRPVVDDKKEDPIAALMRAGDHLLRVRREHLALMEFEHRQKIRDIEIEHEKAVASLKAEIAVLAGRMGFEP